MTVIVVGVWEVVVRRYMKVHGTPVLEERSTMSVTTTVFDFEYEGSRTLDGRTPLIMSVVGTEGEQRVFIPTTCESAWDSCRKGTRDDDDNGTVSSYDG